MTEHKQIDTGLGFHCDELMVPLVVNLNQAKIMTYMSCQGDGDNQAWIMFTCYDEVSRLMETMAKVDPTLFTDLACKKDSWTVKFVFRAGQMGYSAKKDESGKFGALFKMSFSSSKLDEYTKRITRVLERQIKKRSVDSVRGSSSQ